VATVKFTYFKNRVQAGMLLAKPLAPHAKRDDVLVLALPRGGVPVGHAVAQALGVPLDILTVRKLGMPGQEELAIGAIAGTGLCVLQPGLIGAMHIPQQHLEAIAERALEEIARRDLLYRADRPPPVIAGRTVILVDDGLATGATMRVAVEAVRKQKPARIVVAVPVGARETCRALRPHVDELVCLQAPEPFYAVGAWYREFGQTSDDEVRRLLQDAWRVPAPPGKSAAR
jgi:putative phosphoribosyl transferase